MQANSRYYVLGYYPPTHPRDGRFHKIEVQVKRPGLRVLARRGYGSPRGRTPEERKRDEEARRAREAKRPERRQDLHGAARYPEQPVAAERAQLHGAGGAVQEHAERGLGRARDRDRRRSSASTRRPNEKGVAANKIELSFYGVNELRQGAGGHAHRSSTSRCKPETRERVNANGVRVNPRISLPPGRYQLRIGAREARRRHDRLGVLRSRGPRLPERETDDGRPAAGRRVGPADAEHPARSGRLESAAGAPRRAGREFPQRDTLALYTEIYDNICSAARRGASTLPCGCSRRAARRCSSSRDELAERRATADRRSRGTSTAIRSRFRLKGVAPGRYRSESKPRCAATSTMSSPSPGRRVITVVPLGRSFQSNLATACTSRRNCDETLDCPARGARARSVFGPHAGKGRRRRVRPYEVVANWPQPIPGTEGYTWGSTGGVFAETPDRVWIVQRGMLPLPAGAKFGVPLQGQATGAQSQKWQHCIFVVDRNGKMVQSWTQHDKIFAREGRARPAQDQDEPVRSAEARVDHGRQPAPALQVHLRRQAGADVGRSAGARRRPDATSAARPTSTGCPTARSSSATATRTRASSNSRPRAST